MYVSIRLLGLVLAYCAVAGCSRYVAVSVPEIRGTLLDEHRVPIANAAVMIAQHSDFDDPCKEATLQGSTDALGEFLIQKRTEIAWELLNDPNDVGQITHLCFWPAGE